MLLALQRTGKPPAEMVEGQFYDLTDDAGIVSRLMPGNLRYPMPDGKPLMAQFTTTDRVGYIALAALPVGDAADGHGPVSAATWDGANFVRPLLNQRTKPAPSAEQLAALVSDARRNNIFAAVQAARPDLKIDADAIGAILAAEADAIKSIETKEVTP